MGETSVMKKSEGNVNGLFITFEGIEGAGKTTQIARAAEKLAERSIAFVRTREPGGSPIADRIRAVILDAKNGGLVPGAELLLILASRAQHVAEVIAPALAAGKIVLCDRFADATEAYQGHARGLGGDFVRGLSSNFAQGIKPDLTILLDMPAEAALTRARSRAGALPEGMKEDRFENEILDFHRKVREGYLAVARREPGRVKVVDARGTPGEVFAKVAAVLSEKIGVSFD